MLRTTRVFFFSCERRYILAGVQSFQGCNIEYSHYMNYDTSSVPYIIWNPALARIPTGSFFFLFARKKKTKKKTVATRATGLARHARCVLYTRYFTIIEESSQTNWKNSFFRRIVKMLYFSRLTIKTHLCPNTRMSESRMDFGHSTEKLSAIFKHDLRRRMNNLSRKTT